MNGRSMDWYNTVIPPAIPRVEFYQNRYSRELGVVIGAGCRWPEIAAGTRLHTGNLDVFASYPMLRRLLPLLLFESLWIRAQAWSPLRRWFGSSPVGYLEKPAA